MELSQDFKEFLELLRKNNVKYLIVGGYAVNFYGYSRYTKDLDIWIWIKKQNIHSLLKSLKEFGFGSLNLNPNDFSDPNNIIQLGFPPYRIDIITDVNEMNFEICYKNRKIFTVNDIEINIISINDLINAKKISGRLQDLADAEFLEKIKANNSKASRDF